MDTNEQRIIDGLFDKLRQAEGGAPPRDPDAERRITGHLGRQPAAPYYMAQAIVVQEQALEAAQQRIQELEEANRRPAGGGGFLGSLFGAGAASQPARHAGPTPGMQQLQHYQQRGGGGFLAGAMQTAMGVAGGMLLGNMLMSAFASDPAAAAEPAEEELSPEEDMGGFDEEL